MVPEHYTKETVSATCYCRKCGRETLHRVDGGRRGSCRVCMDKLEEEHKKAVGNSLARQEDLFK
jgi:hypothetical protein